MDMQEGADGQQLRPGAEHLRQAIICIPVALVALVLMAALEDSNEMLSTIAAIAAVLFGAIGVGRLAQGLWHRVA